MALQEVLFQDRELFSLPFVDELLTFEALDYFPLLQDPRKMSTAYVIGMVVVRSANAGWSTPWKCRKLPDEMTSINDWTFSLNDSSDGTPISNSSRMDAYRLALQYAMSDAVIVGAKTAVATPKHIWQPSYVTGWAHLRRFAQLGAILKKQRKMLQDEKYLSAREDPAQMVLTRPGDPAVLQAAIFDETSVERPFESYVVTTPKGKERLREEKGDRLASRFDDVVLPWLEGDRPNQGLIRKLREELDIRIINHDGGAECLKAFLDESALDQFNVTFAGGKSLKEIVGPERSANAEGWGCLFKQCCGNDGSIPPAEKMRPFAATRGTDEDVMFVSFDCRGWQKAGV